jgi:hypothetical protein
MILLQICKWGFLCGERLRSKVAEGRSLAGGGRSLVRTKVTQPRALRLLSPAKNKYSTQFHSSRNEGCPVFVSMCGIMYCTGIGSFVY